MRRGGGGAVLVADDPEGFNEKRVKQGKWHKKYDVMICNILFHHYQYLLSSTTTSFRDSLALWLHASSETFSCLKEIV